MGDVKTDATYYILTVLLQRLETSQPGILHEMYEGVQSDLHALAGQTETNGSDHIGFVFQEALRLLSIAQSATHNDQ